MRESTDGALKRLVVRSREAEADQVIVNHVEEVVRKLGITYLVQGGHCLVFESYGNPIVGLSSKERVNEAVASIQVKLTDDEISMWMSYIPKSLSGWGGKRRQTTR